ncbi:MAG: cyclase family protein [Chitinophagaceae bacterium]|nr:MAG: cyclase family protein [Chitinophagaceae bacterium]
MIAKINLGGEDYSIDLSQPLDISLTLSASPENPIAWYLEQPEIKPVVMGDWIGKVAEGKSSTNFNNVFFNPHGHGTHTECLGHITRDFYGINSSVTNFFYRAELISFSPESINGDWIITDAKLKSVVRNTSAEAIIIRTFPNETDKKSRKYSNTNPPYLTEKAALWLREIGIKHLLVDLPSVDREHDQGKLLAHKAFWNVLDVDNLNADARLDATITELIFVPDAIPDGDYLLNLQVASFENDAAPSRPVLYRMENAQG